MRTSKVLTRRLLPAFFGLALAVLAAGPVSAKTEKLTSDDNPTTSWRGTLVAMSGTTLPATLTLQVDTTTYTVNVTSATTLVRKFNGPSSLEEFGLLDDLKVRGTLDGTTITATHIKNYSIQRKGGEFWGTILSIDATAKSFVMKPKERSQQTVKTDVDTEIFQGNRAGEFTDLAVGQSVKVIGLWRKSQSIVEADRVNIKLTEIEGTVAAVDCTAKTLTVNRKYKGEVQSWAVTLTDQTVIRDKELDPIACADIKVNDRVSVRGLKSGTTSLTALQVHDKGVKKSLRALFGEIESISSADKTFVLKTKKQGTLTVSVTTESILVSSAGLLISFDQLLVGHEVSIRGSVLGATATVNLLIDKDLP